MMPLDSLPQRERVTDLVYEKLHQALVSGALAPGTRLSVPDIARQLGVSRSPVREAVQRLVRDGLARDEPHRGASVTELSAGEVAMLYETREVLEGLAARLAAGRATDDQRGELRRTLDEHEAAVARGDTEAHVRCDLAFHVALRNAAANADLGELLERIQDKVLIGMLSGDTSTWPKKAVAEHRTILDAVLAGDADAAERAARAHIARVRGDLTRLREEESPASA